MEELSDKYGEQDGVFKLWVGTTPTVAIVSAAAAEVKYGLRSA